MATFSTVAYFPITTMMCSSNRASYEPNKKSRNNIKINGTSTKSTTKVDMASTWTSVASVSTENGYISEQQVRQNIPTTKQSVDHYRQGMSIEGGVGYRQRVVIRSYEVGPDKTATLESILNLLQVIINNLTSTCYICCPFYADSYLNLISTNSRVCLLCRRQH